MYHLFGLEKNLETIAIVSKNFLSNSESKLTFGALKNAYFKFTKYVCPQIPMPNDYNKMVFVDNTSLHQNLLSIFLDDVNSACPTISGMKVNAWNDSQELDRKYQLIKKTLLHYKDQDQNLHVLTNLLFTYILVVKVENVACATVPRALGLILFDHKIWQMKDICEMFLHETTHQLVTLDEHRYQYYLDHEKLLNSDYYALSTIRKTKRPLPKVIHSLIVASEIVSFREKTMCHKPPKIHPHTDALKKQIHTSLKSLEKSEIKNILGPRVHQILDKIRLIH